MWQPSKAFSERTINNHIFKKQAGSGKYNVKSATTISKNLSRLPADYAKCQCKWSSWRPLIGPGFHTPAEFKASGFQNIETAISWPAFQFLNLVTSPNERYKAHVYCYGNQGTREDDANVVLEFSEFSNESDGVPVEKYPQMSRRWDVFVVGFACFARCLHSKEQHKAKVS